MTPETRAKALMAARAARHKITLPVHDRPTTWDEARQTADYACIGEPVAWKLGGTTQFVRDIFNIDWMFYGPLGRHEVYEDGQTATVPPLPGPVAEPEIAVRLNCDIEPDSAPRSDAQIIKIIDAVAPALDIAAVALEDPASEGVLSLISDRAGTGLVLTGKWDSPSILQRLTQQPVKLLLDGQECSSGNADVLLGGIYGALRDFFVQAARENRTLYKGAIIATGGLAPAIPIGDAKTVTASFEGWQTAHFALEYV